jgi:hypothetical protein
VTGDARRDEHAVSPSVEYADLVRAWAGALSAGSTQTWAEFLDGPTAFVQGTSDEPLPGAAQLELVRRLSARPDVTTDLPEFARLAELILTTAGPGRGLVDVPLPWPVSTGSTTGGGATIGTPPVTPEALPAEELLRVCTGVLVRLLAAEPAAPAARVSRSWRPWRRGFTLLGAPTTVDLVRAALRERGLREGGSRTTYFVLGGPLEDLMAQRWSARVRAGGAVRWQRMWRIAATNDRVPPGIALPTIATHVAEEFAPDRVHVVLAEDPATTLAMVGDILGVPAAPVAARYDALATDLLRRINPVLALTVGEEARRHVVARVWPEISAGEEPGQLGAPAGQLDWAVETGARMATSLAGARYAVHGDPALVVPTRRPGVRRSPDPDDVLAHALVVVGRAWRRTVAVSNRGGQG